VAEIDSGGKIFYLPDNSHALNLLALRLPSDLSRFTFTTLLRNAVINRCAAALIAARLIENSCRYP